MSEFFTMDLWALIPATVLLFAAEHLIMASLAEHYEWARLSRTQAYTMGVGTLFALFFVHAMLNDRLAEWVAFAILTGCAGLTIKVLWAVNPNAQRMEQPTGVDLTNSSYSHTHVVALMENVAAFVAQIQMNSENSAEAADMLATYFRVMRENPKIDPDLPVQVIKRKLARQVGERQ